MSSGSIIQGMFLLQPTSKWVGRSDSQDETLDRTNPPWLYHPECLQILHVPKEAQNIVLTRFIEKTVSVPLYLYFISTVQLKCGGKNITLPQLCFIWIIWLELSCFLNFLQEHMRPLLDIRSVCFSPRHLLIICSFPDTPHHLWWCQNLPHLPQLNLSLSKRWLTDYIQYCPVSLSIF